jgi:carboxypeptidase family protein
MPEAVLALACVLTIPAAAFAQAAVAGSAKDPFGAPLPGVTVVATSPALIEKTRTAVTDENGRYRIEDLRPGVYTVRFTLTGWTPYQVEGVELTVSPTAVVDARMSVGPLKTEVTVTGRIPVVDTQAVQPRVYLGREVVRSIPTVRSYNALLVLVPGVLTNVNDTVLETATASFPIHGGRTNEGRLLVDGLNIGSPPSGNSATSYAVDVGAAQEIAFAAAGALGESETAGLVMNIVPKTGGNTVRGSLFAGGTGEALQSANLRPSLRAQGVLIPPLAKAYDVSGTIGGPIARDRVWYFATGHIGGSTKRSPNVYYNLNAGNPRAWLYAPDVSRAAYSDRTFENASGRITWQATRRNRFGGFWDAQALCRTCTGATPGLSEPALISPEAVGVLGRPLHVTQATWWSPLSSRLLLEAGFGSTYFGVGNFEREPNPTRDLIRVAEQCASGCAANGNIPGLVYRSQDFSRAYTGSYLWKGSLSYVTGSHALKAGYQHTFMTDDRTWFTNTQNLTYRLNNGAPNQLTESISPWVNDTRVAWQGLFAQEQWTRERLTLHGAVRFDRVWSWFPEQKLGPSRFLPDAIVIPQTRGVDSYKDVTYRMGAAYDVFGNGRTAIKVSAGKYLDGAGASGNYANTNPTLRMPQTTSTFGTAGVTRAWTDANGNLVPDCDLLNPSAQDLRSAGGDLCGIMSNTAFGRYVLTNNFDSAILSGWGVRPSDWTVNASFEQQIGRRSSLAVTYTRRSFQGFFAADNQTLQPTDFTPFSIVAPRDPRLPGGGGYEIAGLYDVVPDKAGQVDNLITSADRFGTWSQYYNGVDVAASVRMARGFTFLGGTSTGQTVADNCAVRTNLPELATTTTGTSAFGAGLQNSAVTPVSPYCHVAYGILTQFRGLSSYTIPRIDLQVSAVVQSKPGAMLQANYAVPNADVVPSLRRNLSGNATNVTVNLIPAGTMRGDRINQVDLRFAKAFRGGGTRTTVGVDVFNALNSSAVLTYNGTFVPGGMWPQPLTILTPRFFRITAEVDF